MSGPPTADTIWAPATAPGRAGIAVIRVSGPTSAAALETLTRRALPPPRQAALRRFYDPATGDELDQGLALRFPAPASFTGEDMVELHHHGGRAVAAAFAACLAAMPGLRPAEPGEFTRRAFLNGRLDLTQAEAIADLVDAQTQAQHRQAVRQLEGALGEQIKRWSSVLLDALARLEAEIDFAPEEGDVPEGLLSGLRPALRDVGDELAAAMAASGRAERLREGLVVAVVGPPNAGKSTLVNLLAGREVAIVTARPGTTRDVLEVGLELGGFPVTLLDTAGLRVSDDEVERLGIERARCRAESADLRLAVLDAASAQAAAPAAALAGLGLVPDLVVLNKIDLLPAAPEWPAAPPAFPLSCQTGEGLDGLLQALAHEAAARMATEGAAFGRTRHRAALADCGEALRRVVDAPPGHELALLAEDLRLAVRALGRITGAVDVEDVLDRIFASFCIGK